MKILIFIENDQYIRNYISTKAFSKLASHELKYFISEEVMGRNKMTNCDICDLKIGASKIQKIAYRLVNQIQMYERSKLNKNFLFRLKRELIPNFQTLFIVPEPFGFSNFDPLYLRVTSIFKKPLFLQKFVLFLASIYKVLKNTVLETLSLIRYLLIILMVKLRLKDIIVRFLWDKISLNKQICEILYSENPDLILIPNSIVGPESYEILRVLNRQNKCKSLFLVDNWDNLSSKSTFIFNPDYLGVWGKQSVEFAHDFHGMNKKYISIIGTPRFEVYENYQKNENQKKLNESLIKPYILFVGCALGFDELGALNSVSQALNKVIDKFPPETYILYRPHPWGGRSQYLSTLRSFPIDRVVIDPQILASEGILGSNFQPSLDYYPQLLHKALFIICPLSTMIIESTIMGKHVLALAHEDKYSLFSPNRIFSNYKHFEGLDRLSNVKFIDNLEKLPSSLLSMYSNHSKVVDITMLDYYISANNKEDYATRLAFAVNEIEKNLI